jgi:hypothetical protein
MNWLRRAGLRTAPAGRPEEPPRPPAPEGPPKPPPERVEGSAPGVAEMLGEEERLTRAEVHARSLLDLGPASGDSLQVYRRFARRVGFADLFAEWTDAPGADPLEALPAPWEPPFDLIFTWDTVDRLEEAEERARLVRRLAGLVAPGGRVHLLVRSSDSAPNRPLRFGLLDRDRMYHEPVGPPRPTAPPILPAQMETLLEPLEVIRGFTLKGGLREYVARLPA